MEGVIAAVPTPVDTTCSPMREPFIEHCNWILRNGGDGLNVLGSTGEANSFDNASRRQVMAWAAEAFPKERLMVGTGTPSLQETVALTTFADDLGFPIALVLPPYYYKPLSPSGLQAWYLALHDALGSRDIQIYFYNFPQMTGISIPVEIISDLVSVAPNRFTGIKDSSGDLDYCRSIVSTCPSLNVFPSSETVLQSAAVDGFAGCISASANVTAPIAAQVWSRRAVPPRTICDEIARQRGLLAGPTLIPGIKFLVGLRSNDIGWRRVLPPFTALPETVGEQLSKNLDGS